jgi:hypothetical protein
VLVLQCGSFRKKRRSRSFICMTQSTVGLDEGFVMAMEKYSRVSVSVV